MFHAHSSSRFRTGTSFSAHPATADDHIHKPRTPARNEIAVPVAHHKTLPEHRDTYLQLAHSDRRAPCEPGRGSAAGPLDRRDKAPRSHSRRLHESATPSQAEHPASVLPRHQCPPRHPLETGSGADTDLRHTDTP